MKESILYYIWQNKLFPEGGLTTVDGKKIEVIDTGILSTDAGPDFFNAKVKIENTIWVGNIEVHQQSTDWKKHNHTRDKSYDNVILHIVNEYNAEIYRTNGTLIPQLLLACPPYIKDNYDELISNHTWIRCASKISSVPSIVISSWKNALLAERLEKKTHQIIQLLKENNLHWEEAFYITLARNFGFSLNGQTFELLAKSIPLQVLGKHKDQLIQIEALLFGQSGLLENAEKDQYVEILQKEYSFLKTKYDLVPLQAEQWKMLRLRPDNFPHIRLAQFAALIHTSSKLFSKIVENSNLDYLYQLFSAQPSAYWLEHYTFSKKSKEQTKNIGKTSINTLIINTIVPFLFCYSSHKNLDKLKELALKMLEDLPPEKNAIVRKWNDVGVESSSAYDTQALIELKKNYCDTKKCLRCRIGHKVFTLKKEI